MFARVAKGRYALAALPGVVPLAPDAKPPLPPPSAPAEAAPNSNAAASVQVRQVVAHRGRATKAMQGVVAACPTGMQLLLARLQACAGC